MFHQSTARKALVIALFVTTAAAGFAGDVSNFANLGFSADSRVFMFGVYGVDGDSGYPFAEIYTVDVPDNKFVSGGVFTRTFPVAIQVGQDGHGALYQLLPQAIPIVRHHSVNHLRQGRLIYLLVNGQEPKATLNFRDFETGTRFHVTLSQQSEGEGPSGRAAFFIDVDVTFPDERTRHFRVGRPGYFRDGVNRYRIAQILLSPDERSLVFVVEKVTDHDTGEAIRFMVETVRIR